MLFTADSTYALSRKQNCSDSAACTTLLLAVSMNGFPMNRLKIPAVLIGIIHEDS